MRPIMLVGTGSDVGKSWIVAGICRWLKNRDHQPAPFKAQNMSLNSYATPEGLEIGRAQAVQAEASKVACSVLMNPVLLKPSSVNKSQVVLLGQPIGDQTAKEYFLGDNKKHLFEEAKKAFNELNQSFSPIVMEGAGSISELNLKHRDIVNMRMAKAANACVYLVADIDRGGVFGSVYGTIALLEDWERDLVKGIIINKFRGDARLFDDGRKKLEELTGVPVLGVLPYDKDIHIEEEDSVALSTRHTKPEEGKLNIAVVQLKYLSNYTDFQPLELHEKIHTFYTRDKEDLERADVIILPGTKNTIKDLQALKEEGLDQVIQSLYSQKPIIGICGGYQMMGVEVSDPYQVETEVGTEQGLGLFPIKTVLTKEKQTVQQTFQFKDYIDSCVGYEIHMGETTIPDGKEVNNLKGRPEGYLEGNAWGTYLHGIFENSVVVNELLAVKFPNETAKDYHKIKEENYEKLASLIDENLDMSAILNDIELE